MWRVGHSLLGMTWLLCYGLIGGGAWLRSEAREPLMIVLAVGTIAVMGLFHMLDRRRRP